MNPYIEPKDKNKLNYLYKGYLKGFISAETYINYCQGELSKIMEQNKEILERLKNDGKNN